MRFHWIVPLLLLTSLLHAAEGGPDAGRYRWQDNRDGDGPAYTWIDTAGGRGVGLANSDDNIVSLDLLFPFPLYDRTFTRVNICTNGWISFGDPIWAAYSAEAIPNRTVPNGVFVYWDDLVIGPTDIVMKSYMDADGPKAAITWTKVTYYGDGDDSVSFQVILGADGGIRFQYAQVSVVRDSARGRGGSASIGIQNEDGIIGLTYSYRDPVLADGRAVVFRVDSTLSVTNGSLTRIVSPGAAIDSMIDLLPTVVYRNRGTVALPATEALCAMFHRDGTEFYRQTLSAAALAPGAELYLAFPAWTPSGADTDSVTFALADSDDVMADNIVARSFRVGLALDAGMGTILAPLGSVRPDSAVTPSVVVTNYGEGEISRLVVHCVIANNPVYEAYHEMRNTEGLAVGESRTITFPAFLSTDPGLDTLTFYLVAGDVNPLNDSLRGTFLVVGHVSHGGPDLYGYRWWDSTYPAGPVCNYQDIHTTGTLLEALNGDDVSVTYDLPWPFVFYNRQRSQVTICTNGFLVFDSTSANNYDNLNVPDTVQPNNAVYPYWDDLFVDLATGGVYWESRGEAPNRKLIVQWYNASTYDVRDTFGDFEVILDERDSSITCQYRSVAFNGGHARAASATIGIEDETGIYGLAYCGPSTSDFQHFDAPYAIRFAFEEEAGVETFPMRSGGLRAYPNPVRGTVVIEGGRPGVWIDVYDLLGTRMARFPAGEKAVWDVRDVAAGVYHIRCGGESLRILKVKSE